MTLEEVNHHILFVHLPSKVMLQVLYKLKTAKVFERTRGKEDKPNTDIVDEDPFAIQTLSWCPESRMLCVAGVSAHVIVYRFSKQEVTAEVIQVGAESSESKRLLPEFRRWVSHPEMCLLLVFSSWKCECSVSLAMWTPLIQEGSRPPPCRPLQPPPALRRANLSIKPRQAAAPLMDPETIYHVYSMDSFIGSVA